MAFLRLGLALRGLRIFPFRCWMRLGWRQAGSRCAGGLWRGQNGHRASGGRPWLIPLPLGALDWHFLGVAALRILREWQIGGRALGWFAL
ncbi:MAG: hypothetical protein NTZ64_07140 [Polaromonas sp.]|nr:hypothetical protein [Polaromonas sp.]